MILTRRMSHYMITYYLPSSLFVVVSWTSFLIPSEDIQGRMALLVTLFLVLVRQQFLISVIYMLKYFLSYSFSIETIWSINFQPNLGKYFQYNNNKFTKGGWIERDAILGYLLHIFCLRCIVWIRYHTFTGIILMLLSEWFDIIVCFVIQSNLNFLIFH